MSRLRQSPGRIRSGSARSAHRCSTALQYLLRGDDTNEEESDGFLGEEDFETGALDASSRDFLESAIKDYNGTFGTSFDTSADRFQNYYKDLSLRLKDRELDIVIVVNMFLTGFDATMVNTLWVDKNLRSHGLIQAYSRTNRILNSVKTYGTIVSFRDLEEATNDALALFGNKDARGVVILKPYGDYYGEYEKQVAELLQRFPLDDAPYVGEANQKAFIALFGAILRLRNILTSFDEFAGHELISPRDFQDFQSVYLNLYADWRGARDAEKESINDDVVFEIELIKQVEVNVEYILTLVQALRDSIGNSDLEMDTLMTIQRAVDSSPSLRNKKDLILQFVDSVSVTADTSEDWKIFINAKRDAELDALIADEALKAAETKTFVANAFRDGAVPTAGTAITRILPPASRFAPGGHHGTKKQRVLDKLADFFDRYFGLV
jgi:type I restriction enzyme, R subunit